MKYLPTLALLAFILFLGYALWQLDKKLQQQTSILDSNHIELQLNKRTVALLNDSIRQKDSLLAVYRIEREALEKEVSLLRAKYEEVRPYRSSRSVDTLHVIIGLCDSTVVGQDSLIRFLNDELNMQFELTELQRIRGDTLQFALEKSEMVIEEVEQKSAKELRREKWKRRLQVAGMAILAVLVSLLK